jgi:hypothetical protein
LAGTYGKSSVGLRHDHLADCDLSVPVRQRSVDERAAQLVRRTLSALETIAIEPTPDRPRHRCFRPANVHFYWSFAQVPDRPGHSSIECWRIKSAVVVNNIVSNLVKDI